MATQLSTFVSWLESDKNSCFLAGLNDKQSAMRCACNVGDLVSIPGPEISLVKGMGTHSGILAWELHGQRSLADYSPWRLKELDMTERLTVHFTDKILP